MAGFHTDAPDEKPGWWDDAVGPGKMFDTDRYFVVCSNVIGGCQGSTGPSSIAPDGKPYGMRFPVVTIADMVQAQRHLMDALGIERWFAVAGGSMGAMQALQWAVETPERVANVIFLASTPRSSALQIAFNETGRQAIYADPNWRNGDYYGGPAPESGLAVARMVAHITYMSDRSMESKFGRRLQDADTLPYRFDRPGSRSKSGTGAALSAASTPTAHLHHEAIDYFDIGADYGSFLVASFSSDWLRRSRRSKWCACSAAWATVGI